MPRLPRVVAVGLPHHVTQRGNYRQNVFSTGSDRLMYLSLLREYSRPAGLRVIGYCLMTNHVHLIVIPGREDSLARAIGQAHCRFAHAVHARRQSIGHLWQNRFYSAVMDETHLFTAMRYVECNPVRAGLAASAEDYPWSSATAHLTGSDLAGTLDLTYWTARVSTAEWRQQLNLTPDDADLAMIRARTAAGRPIGSKLFLAQLSRTLGRTLEPRRVGRPRKSTTEEHSSTAQGALF